MSEERFDRIESTLEVLKSDVGQLRTDVTELRTDVNGLKVDVKELSTDVNGLKADVTELRTDVTGLKTDVTGLRTDVTGLRHYMGVIHEDLIDRIRASAEPVELLRREFRSGLEQLRADTDQRLRPLEVVVTEHSKDIASLKSRRRSSAV
jgi:chromosome segregation ATPase